MSLVIGRKGPSELVVAARRLMLVGWQIAKKVLLLAILGVPPTHSSLPFVAVAAVAFVELHLGGVKVVSLPGGNGWCYCCPSCCQW